jgi:hypothetical protein
MKIKNIIKREIDRYKKWELENSYKKRITKNFNNLKVIRKLTKEQKNEIQNFYKNLIGKKVSLYSHEYFYSRTGVYSKEYIPTNLYHVDLLPKANMLPYRDAYADKNMTDIILPNVKHPHTLLKNMNGYYYFEGKPVSEEDAINLCSNLEDVLIKPTLSYSGQGIQALTVHNGQTNINGMTLNELFKLYNKNFQIQKRLKQHDRMNKLNPTSVNTIRILTYRSDMEILIVYAVVRIGRLGEVIDNQCAGGISAIIDEEGKLGKYGFSGYASDNIEITDVGTVLNGYKLPSYDKAIETVKRLHFQLPFFDLIGWDIAIDDSGDPVVLEWNVKTGLSQSAFGPGFGKYTERIIKELWQKQNSLNSNW